MSKIRLKAVMGAVIVIVITRLILELRQPAIDAWAALDGIEYKFSIYAAILAMLAIYWNNHHYMFQLVHKRNGRALWINNFLFLS